MSLPRSSGAEPRRASRQARLLARGHRRLALPRLPVGDRASSAPGATSRGSRSARCWAMAALQVASLACLWALQHVALRARRWRPVITSQLAGNALAKVAPGGGAMGSALQYRMLVQSGAAARRDRVGADRGQPARVRRRARAAGAGDPGAAARRRRPRPCWRPRSPGWRSSSWPATSARCSCSDRPPAGLGRAGASSASATASAAAPSRCTRCPSGCCASATGSSTTLGPRWKRALAATVGRWTFDYLTLLAALAAIGSHPRPGLVLLAFCGAQVLAQIPVTPGGLGFVEAGLTAMLALAGRQRRRRGAGDVRLPPVLVLAAAAARPRRVRAALSAVSGAVTAAAGRGRARPPRGGGRRRACGRCCAGAS